MLQSLPSMLRMQHAMPIRSCSKAPGVFSSNYRYPASSPEVHFHRASPRDSFPVITPFVHVGTYPTRNYALGSFQPLDSIFTRHTFSVVGARRLVSEDFKNCDGFFLFMRSILSAIFFNPLSVRCCFA